MVECVNLFIKDDKIWCVLYYKRIDIVFFLNLSFVFYIFWYILYR